MAVGYVVIVISALAWGAVVRYVSSILRMARNLRLVASIRT